MRPPHPAPITAEALVRMHGELTAAGFDVQVSATSADEDARSSLERIANQAGADAVLAILGDNPLESVEVWVVDRVTGKSVVRRLVNQPDSDRPAELLAVRALELLRASFLEASLVERQVAIPRVAPPVEVSRFTAEPVDERGASDWAVEAGAGLLNGMGTTVMPVLRGQRRVTDVVLVRLTAAGAGTHALAEGRVGSARIAQQFALVEGVFPIFAGRSVQPFFTLGVGTSHASVQGQAPWPYQTEDASCWSGLADAGLGVRLALTGRYEAALELHAQLAHPYPLVRILGQEVARGGRPNFLLSLTVLAWL
jgi:hypothetical protein